MTDLISEQLDLAFDNRLHPRGKGGRWVKKAGTLSQIEDLLRPAHDSGGVLPASQRFGRQTGEERLVAGQALRRKQHANRRAAGQTWTVDEQGQVIRHAHAQHLLGAWEFIGTHGSKMGNAFLPGNAEPKVGDLARNSQGNVGRVVAKAGGHAVIDDVVAGRRHLVDWRNGGVAVRSDPLPASARGQDPRQGLAPDLIAGRLPTHAGSDPRPVGIELDPHPPNPFAPYLVHGGDGAEWHIPEGGVGAVIAGINKRAGIKMPPEPSEPAAFFRLPANTDMQRSWRKGDKVVTGQGTVGTVVSVVAVLAMVEADDGNRYWVNWKQAGKVIDHEPLSRAVPPLPPPPTPSPPGVMVAPGVKQYLLPGMPEGATGAVARLRQITHDDLESGTAETPHQGIQGSVEIVTLASGEKVLHKKYTRYNTEMADNDELAYYVSEAVGAGAPAVARPKDADEGEVVEDFVPGVMAERYAEDQAEEEGTYPDQIERELELSPQGEKIGLLDYLIANRDRHDQNWMVTDDGTPVPIDMSSSFKGFSTSSPFWNDAGVSQSDYDEMLEKLEAIEPEFTRLGHADWFVDMMGRFSDITPVQDYGMATELGWRFDPSEARDAHGRWTHGGSGYVSQDPSRLIIPHAPKNTRFPYYRAPTNHPFFKAHPVSAANVIASYDASSPQERAQGMRWYADAHTLAKAIGGGDAAKGAGLLASYSPQSAWPVNMFNAARAVELGRALGPGDGMITGSMRDNAQQILDGHPLDTVFGRNKAPKIRAFAHLILNGGDDPADTAGNVVIDRHAMSVALGTRLAKKEADKAPIGTNRYYQHVADAYRDAAVTINARGGEQLSPHQVQAITWLHQQSANAAEDKAGAEGHGGKGAGKGRQVMIRNAWKNWQQLEQTEHYPVVSGTTEMAGGIAAQMYDLAAWEHELRDTRGRWTRFGGVGEAADTMMKNREGFSVSVRSGRQPAHGYMVAQTDHTHVYPESILDDHMALTRAIDDMLVQEKSAFASGDTYLGGWVHDGKLWLEPSDNIASKEQAVAEGTERNQIAVWDVDHGEEIQTGGSGGGRIYEHANAQGRGGTDPGGLRGPARGGAAAVRGGAGSGNTAGIAAQLDLTGDGHGHHIPGTPIVYRHGWKQVHAEPAAVVRARMNAADPAQQRLFKATGYVPNSIARQSAVPITWPRGEHGSEIEEQRRLLSQWTRSFRYLNITGGTPRDADFIDELHRMLTDSSPPGYDCGPGCQDAHEFMSMVDKTAEPIDTEMARGISLLSSDTERMFPVGKPIDLPIASWSKGADTAIAYASSHPPAPGKVHVIMHAPPGSKGMDLEKYEKGGGTWLQYQAELREVLTGGRYTVQSVRTEGDMMHVQLGPQEDFSAK